MRSTALAMLMTLLATAIAQDARAMQTPPAIIEGRALADAAKVSINPRDGSRLTVVVFLSARCPCSASHEPLLATMAREFGKEARFVGIHSNADEPAEESAAHFKQAALPFPVVQDEGSRLANAFGAVKTPHAFILGKNGEILYQGGVDNSHSAARASKPYLMNALYDLREGRAPEINLARSIGCTIRR